MLVRGARNLDRALDRFRARIAEKHRVGKGQIYEPLSQMLALGAAIEVRDVHQRLRLARDRSCQASMAVAEGIDRNPGSKIQVSFAVLADQVAVIATHRPYFAPAIDGHERSDRHLFGP